MNSKNPHYLSIKHLGEIRSFEVKSDSEPTVDLGGYTNELTNFSGGSSVKKQTIKNWEIASLTIGIDADNGDVEYLQEINDSAVMSEVTLEITDGTLYTGVGTITGDLKPNLKDCSVEITLAGQGQLKRA